MRLKYNKPCPTIHSENPGVYSYLHGLSKSVRSFGPVSEKTEKGKRPVEETCIIHHRFHEPSC